MRRLGLALVVLALLSVGAKRRSPPLGWYEPALPTTMHPLYAASITDLRAHALVYDRLFVESPVAGGWTSRIVAEHTLGGGSIALRLVEGIRWHDGERLTATDVCYTVDALRDPESTSPLAQRLRHVLRRCAVDPEDPLRAEITLASRPMADERVHLDFPIVPAHLSTGPPGPLHPIAQQPVGTGPMEARFDGRHWRFTAFANPHHAPSVRAMRLEAGPAPALQVAALLAGGIGGIAEVPPAHLPEIRASEVADLHFYPRREWWSIAVDTADGILSDARVREALDLMLDREALRAAVVGRDPERDAQPSRLVSGPFPADSPSYNRGVAVPRHDPDRATALLEAAGLEKRDGVWTRDGLPVRLRLGVQQTLPIAAERVADAIAAQWSDFRIEPVVIPPERFRTRALPGLLGDELDLLVVAWHVAPEQLEAVLHTRGPRTGAFNVFDHSDPEIDRLLAAAASAPDASRHLLHHQLHARLADTRPHLFLWRLDAWSAWSRALRHAPIAPLHYFTDLDHWQLEP